MNSPTYNDLVKVRIKLKEVGLQHWIYDDLFTWHWWFLLFSTVIPWIIWYIFRDKKNTYEQLSYGLLWVVISSTLDVIGVDLILWGYPDKLLPMVPPLFPADVAVIPVLFMFVFQFATKFKTYLISSIGVSACFSFIFEPLFIRGNMFVLHRWNHIYSFFGFLLFSLIIYYIIKKLAPING